MFKSIRNMLAIPELRQRIFFTIAIFFVYRVGGHIPVPGVNAGVLSAWFNQNAQGGLFGFIDMFAAGNLRKATIFALGIMPYISASIIIQLLTAVVPALEKLSKEGDAGIGNGMSLIIFIGIIARIPADVTLTMEKIGAGDTNLVNIAVILFVMVVVVAGVVVIQQGQRKIRVQYAKRIVGRKIYGGQSTHIPLRVNTAGVIPIIFASALIMFPNTILMFTDADWLKTLAGWLSPGNWLYMIVYGGMIIFFSYFYTAIVLNPADLADNMKKYGGFIPGIRPGKNTELFIDRVLTRITLAGSVFLALIALLPVVMAVIFKSPITFGGTGLLIVVGVALDTIRQIESHMLMRHYDGFLKKGRIRGRR
ncbi:MAG: preprotein translocase subunit SecY [bacterium]|nr:preprotein translocase subunit SecY [bacterium]